MSLYYEAAALLENADKTGGSFKARIFKKKDLKSKPGQIYALVAEAGKWSRVLKEVVDKCAVLREERKLTPVLALLLAHDLLLSKAGVAAHKDHVLRLAIERHKARLTSEFRRLQIKHRFPTLDAFRAAINAGELDDDDDDKSGPEKARHPRWVRVNTIKSTLAQQLDTTFKGYTRVGDVREIMQAKGTAKSYYEDPNIPNLLALPPRVDLIKAPAYTKGEIIFQDKASCFPAYLLDLQHGDGDVIDGCAAPGNKTTHAAASVSGQRKVIAFERDKGRTEILKKMVKLAGADTIVTVKGASDFIAAKPNSPDYENVTAILLDPSCSGTGIVGRDDAIKLHLPTVSTTSTQPPAGQGKNKKRKRGVDDKATPASDTKQEMTLDLDDTTAQEEVPLDAQDKLADRLKSLSTFQLHILTHAMRFPAARKITYSTCSIHFEENEGVVFQALATAVAKERGWRILKREEQVDGLKTWNRRGEWEDGKLSGAVVVEEAKADVLQGCIRCAKATDEGTMGFFVAAFVREGGDDAYIDVEAKKSGRDARQVPIKGENTPAAPTEEQDGIDGSDDEEEWDGFSDDDKAAELKSIADAVVEGGPEEKMSSGKKEKEKKENSRKKRRKTGK